MKMTSRFALVAAAGMLMAVAPAKAADLGGGCCADLEERVAELEATTARKGNRVVSLQVYGQVNKALLLWDDGFDDDAYIVDNDFSMSRLGFRGSASMKEGWTAGYHIELGIRNDSSARVDQTTDDSSDQILIRHNNLYIESATLGRITIGQQDTATSAITEINLGGSHENSYGNYSSFFIRDSTFGVGVGRIGDVQNNLNGGRANVIRYDTPSIYGFIASASWGEDDRYDLALRFKKEWNSIRIAAGIGYGVNEEGAAVELDVLNPATFGVTTLGGADFVDTEVLSGSVSVMHVPTGIYGMFAAGEVEYESDTAALDGLDGDFYYVQLGIERRLTPYGSTVFFGEYGDYQGATAVAALFDAGTEMWGVGITQNFDSAALQVYASYRNYEFNSVGDDFGFPLEDFDAFLVGSKIRF
ncbi:MAG: porin [Rhodomicrobiaceae bacterium]